MARLLAVALGAVLVVGGIFAISAVLSARDDSQVVQAEGPGTGEPDRGAEHGAPAGPARDPVPTSGPHAPELVTRDAQALSEDELLHALELGDVVLTYPDAEPPAALRALQEDVAGPFDSELAAAGQAVVLARVPGSEGVQALAWRRRLRAAGPEDRALREFAEYWLGRGADGGR